jgi:hypothetical protein
LLRRMYVVLLQSEIFCRYQLGPFDLWCHLVLGFLCWFFCLDDWSIGDREVLGLPLPLCWSLNVLLHSLVYVWWSCVHWHWVHTGW